MLQIYLIIAKCSLYRYLSLLCYVEHIIATKKVARRTVQKKITLCSSPSLYKSAFVRGSSTTTTHLGNTGTINDLIQSTIVCKIGCFETHHCIIQYAISYHFLLFLIFIIQSGHCTLQHSHRSTHTDVCEQPIMHVKRSTTTLVCCSSENHCPLIKP